MKRKPTPAEIAAARAHMARWETPRTPAEDIKLKMVLQGWADPQTVTIDNTIYVAAITGSATVFITGEEGAYQVVIAGNDPAVGAELQLPAIPASGIIHEIWRLMHWKG